MSKVFDLDSMREALDNEFAPVKFTKNGQEFTLRNMMRVGKNDRTQVMTLMKRLQDIQGDEDDTDNIQDPKEIEVLQDTLGEILSLVAADGKGPKLLEAIGDDLQLLSEVMKNWQEATNPGEAEDSPS